MTGVAVDRISQRLDRATTDRRLLDHPFYQAWAAGELTLADLNFYSTQYWRQVETFPTYLRGLAGRLPESSARSSVRTTSRTRSTATTRACGRRLPRDSGAAHRSSTGPTSSRRRPRASTPSSRAR